MNLIKKLLQTGMPPRTTPTPNEISAISPLNVANELNIKCVSLGSGES